VMQGTEQAVDATQLSCMLMFAVKARLCDNTVWQVMYA